MRLFGWTALAFGLAFASASAAADPQPVIDNPEVQVLDLRLAKGEATPPTSATQDTVILYASAGAVRVEPEKKPAGKAQPEKAQAEKGSAETGQGEEQTHQFGDAVFIPKGARVHVAAMGPEPVHLVMITLKAAPNRIENGTGLPLAFPRPGAVKRLDNAKVVVWNYTWRKNVPTPMHFHDKDVVLAYRYDGTVRSTALDGMFVDNAYSAGEVRFNKGDRVHSEQLLSARQSAVMMELKPQN